MNSSTNPITIFEAGLIAAIKQAQIDSHLILSGTGQVMPEIGTDAEIVGRMLSDSSTFPAVRVRWSPWDSPYMKGGESSSLGLNFSDLTSGAYLWTIFVGCQAPLSRIEAQIGSLGLAGFENVIPAIVEQVHPQSLGFTLAVNSNITNTGVVYWQIVGTKVLPNPGVQAREGASVVALNLVAILSQQTS